MTTKTTTIHPGLASHSHVERGEALAASHAAARAAHAELVDIHRRAITVADAERDAALKCATQAAEAGRVAAHAKLVSEWESAMRPLVRAYFDEPGRIAARKIAETLRDFDTRTKTVLGAPLSHHAVAMAFALVAVEDTPEGVYYLAQGFPCDTQASIGEIAHRVLKSTEVMSDFERNVDDLEGAVVRRAKAALTVPRDAAVMTRLRARFEVLRSELTGRDTERALAEIDRGASTGRAA